MAMDALGNHEWLLPLFYLLHHPQTNSWARGALRSPPSAQHLAPGGMLSAGSGAWVVAIFWSVGQRWESFTAEMFEWLCRIRRWL